MPNDFKEVRVLDNFYQTSSFYPMPVVLVSTLTESGRTNLGPYSLCFPYYITGKTHAMMLICRGSSNTAQNIVRSGTCALNFIPDKKKYMKCCVALGYPGDTTEEKMKNSIFTLAPSERTPQEHAGPFPEIVTEAVQIFECSWDDTFPLKHDEELMEYHFLLHIDKISLKKKWHDCLFKGKGFPRLPIDYGYRDNSRFWFTKHSRPYRVPIPQEKGHTIEAVTYAVQRYDPDITWEEAACKKIIKVPNIFLTKVIAGAVKAAKAEGLTVITPEFLDKLQDKRSSGK